MEFLIDKTDANAENIKSSISQLEWILWCNLLRDQGIEKEKRILALRAMFASIDSTNRGWIRPRDVHKSLTENSKSIAVLLEKHPLINDALSPTNLEATMRDVDKDASRTIDEEEWLTWAEVVREENQERKRRAQRLYDVFYYCIDSDHSWTVTRGEIRTALSNSEERVDAMLRMYPLIRNALKEDNLEKSLRELVPSLNTKDNNSSKNKAFETDSEEEENEEENDGVEEVTFQQFHNWVENLYIHAKRRAQVDLTMTILFQRMDKDQSDTLTKREIRRKLMRNPEEVKELLEGFPNVQNLLHPKRVGRALSRLLHVEIDVDTFRRWIRDMETDAEEQIRRHELLSNLFRMLDKNGNGRLTSILMRNRLDRQKKRISRQLHSRFPHLLSVFYIENNQQDMFDLFDQDHDGNIDIDEFLKGVEIIHRRVQQREDKVHALRVLYRTMDLDGGGTLTKDEIRKCLNTTLNIKDGTETYSVKASLSRFPYLMSCLHPRNFENSMQQLDQDGDGEITLTEFITWVDATEADAIERAKFVPPLETILQLEESSVEALWRIWKEHFLPPPPQRGEKNTEESKQQLIRLVLHKLKRDYAFKRQMKCALPLEVYESIRTMLLEVLVPARWSRFRRQKRLQWGKITLYDFIASVDAAIRKRKERMRRQHMRKDILPIL